MSLTTIADGTGGLVTVSTNDGGTLNNVNTVTQVAAALADIGMDQALAAQKASVAAGEAANTAGVPIAGAVAVVAGGVAFATEIPVLINDLKAANQAGISLESALPVAADFASAAGDLIIAAGGVLGQTPGTQPLGGFLGRIGAGLTLGGAALSVAIKSGQAVTAIQETISAINTDINSAISTLSAAGEAASAVGSLLGALQQVTPFFDSLQGGSVSGAATQAATVLTSLQNCASSLSAAFVSTGATAPNLTETANGNNLTLASSNTPAPVLSAATTIGVTNGTASSSLSVNNGSLDSTLTASAGNGTATTVFQNTLSNGTQNNSTVTDTFDGTVNATLSGQGASLNLNNANVTVASGSSATVTGGGITVAAGSDSQVTVAGSASTSVVGARVTYTVPTLVNGEPTGGDSSYTGVITGIVPGTDGAQVTIRNTDGTTNPYLDIGVAHITSVNDVATPGGINDANSYSPGSQITTGANASVDVEANNVDVTNQGSGCTDGINCTGVTVNCKRRPDPTFRSFPAHVRFPPSTTESAHG